MHRQDAADGLMDSSCSPFLQGEEAVYSSLMPCSEFSLIGVVLPGVCVSVFQGILQELSLGDAIVFSRVMIKILRSPENGQVFLQKELRTVTALSSLFHRYLPQSEKEHPSKPVRHLFSILRQVAYHLQE